MSQVRLQKFLAASGVCSRRKAEQFILDGRVTVNGETALILGTKVNPATDKITVDGKLLKGEEEKVYYLLNKPKGYVTTLSDPQGRPVVTDLLHGIHERVFPVGRLDFDTEGALLLTNDGDLAQKTLHPSYETFKTYEADLSGTPSRTKLRNLEKGILLEGKPTAPARIHILSQKKQSTKVAITIHEGRKHQVKKMFAAIGHPVNHLKRIAYGKLELQTLATGQFKRLSPAEINLIFAKKS